MEIADRISKQEISSKAERANWSTYAVAAMVLVYGAIAGLRTVADFDLGWQMAESREPLSSGDLLSYTAHGVHWIYPRLSGWIFRHLFALGGYAAISWFCAVVLVTLLGVLVWKSRVLVLLLLLVSIPAIAAQMIARSGIFTALLAAVYIRLLLLWYEDENIQLLWPLPLLMALWVNLHPGFIAGLALMGGYVGIELIDFVLRHDAEAAWRRLKRAAPWFIGTVACTFVNPWGWNIYRMVADQEHPTKMQLAIVSELEPMWRNFISGTLNPLNPESAVWWVMAIAIMSVLLLLMQRKIGLALFLTAAIVACLRAARTEVIFLPIACLIGGDALSWGFRRLPIGSWIEPARRYGRALGMAALLCFITARCWAIVTDRSSLREEQITLFGTGPSWWLPENAAAFIESHHLSPQLFAPFNLSSYLIWRLGPQYKDFADGRYLPFGDSLIGEQQMLTNLPLDAPEWQKISEHYGVRTVMFSLSRFYGIEGIPLREDCASRQWSPVYLDGQAIVFVRADLLSERGLQRLRIDCNTYRIAGLHRPDSTKRKDRMESYQEQANAAVIYLALGRVDDAKAALDQAGSIAEDDPSLPQIAAQIAMADGDNERAEQLLQQSLAKRNSDAGWYQLGLLYEREHRYPEAIVSVERAARLAAPYDFQMKVSLGRLQMLAGDEDAALATLGQALQQTPHSGVAGASERAEVLDQEAAAYVQMADWKTAIAAEEAATQMTPDVARRWSALAMMYAAIGDTHRGAAAAQKARDLASENVTPDGLR